MGRVKQDKVIDLEQFRCLAHFVLDRSANTWNVKAAYDLLALIDGQASVHSDAVKWVNRCDRTVPEALRYLANHRRPDGGEQRFNAAHLFQLADEIEHMASTPLYAAPMQPINGEEEK